MGGVPPLVPIGIGSALLVLPYAQEGPDSQISQAELACASAVFEPVCSLLSRLEEALAESPEFYYWISLSVWTYICRLQTTVKYDLSLHGHMPGRVLRHWHAFLPPYIQPCQNAPRVSDILIKYRLKSISV